MQYQSHKFRAVCYTKLALLLFEACYRHELGNFKPIITHKDDGIIRGINECTENSMIAYESKIDNFKEMKYFLMFYLNLDPMVQRAFVLFILSNFSLLPIGFSFSKTFAKLLCNFFSKTALHVFLNHGAQT